jgi:hypothetical protein
VTAPTGGPFVKYLFYTCLTGLLFASVAFTIWGEELARRIRKTPVPTPVPSRSLSVKPTPKPSLNATSSRPRYVFPRELSDFSAGHAALAWLAEIQEPDGHWDATKWDGDGSVSAQYVTGTSLLAFSGAGHTEKSGKYRSVVQKTVGWLDKQHDARGCFAPGGKICDHAVVLLALMEEVAMCPVPRTKSNAAKGLEFLLNSQNEGSGWGELPSDGKSRMTTTVWCVAALKAAKIAGMDVPKSAWDGVSAFLDAVTDPQTGEAGFENRPVQGGQEPAHHSYTMTACALLCRLYLGQSAKDPAFKLGLAILEKNKPQWEQPGAGGQLYLYWYFYYLLAFHLEDNEEFVGMLPLLSPHLESEKSGMASSFPPSSFELEKGGGRVYSTAMAALIPEIAFRVSIISSPEHR